MDKQKGDPTLTIIIISYNTREMTLECLRSVFKETSSVSFEIVVLDNASVDGSYEAINHEFKDRIKLISSAENLGFAKGNNHAASNANGSFYLLLNPDTVVLDGAIDRLMSFAETRSEAGIWGGRTLFADRTLNPESCWSRQTLWSLFSQATGLSSIFRQSSFFNPEALGGWNRDGHREVDIVSGCFLLIRRELWLRLRGFSPEFFMYGEDADLCLRAKAFRARPIVTSEATIIHYGGASENVEADKLVKLLKAKYMLMLQHFHSYLVSYGALLLTAWPLSRWLAHSALSAIGYEGSTNAKEVWKEVWERRNEWIVSR